jgi:predicted nucleotidyltransferase
LTGGSYRDIDVAVWIDPVPHGPGAITRYALDLATELSLALGQPVDVQVLNRAPLAFRHHALKGQPLVVRDWEWLDELRARTWDEPPRAPRCVTSLASLAQYVKAELC